MAGDHKGPPSKHQPTMPHRVTLSPSLPLRVNSAKGLWRWAERCFAAAQHDTRGKWQGENAVMLPVHFVHSKEQGRAPIPGG